MRTETMKISAKSLFAVWLMVVITISQLYAFSGSGECKCRLLLGASNATHCCCAAEDHRPPCCRSKHDPTKSNTPGTCSCSISHQVPSAEKSESLGPQISSASSLLFDALAANSAEQLPNVFAICTVHSSVWASAPPPCPRSLPLRL